VVFENLNLPFCFRRPTLCPIELQARKRWGIIYHKKPNKANSNQPVIQSCWGYTSRGGAETRRLIIFYMNLHVSVF